MRLWGCACLLLVLACVGDAEGACRNGCSSRGLCINNRCVCAEGLSGNDCSNSVSSSLPTLYACPSCYQITVGPARYYTGPYWRFPDTPIVVLNYMGNLSIYMSNSDGELVAQGDSIDDWTPTNRVVLPTGLAGQFDSCGSWLLRAITGDDGRPIGFYHAETSCDYANNGQTRKSGGYSVSNNGGLNYTKTNYPNNKIIDSPSPVLIGRPSGEGDYSVVVKGNYFYLLFTNVEQNYVGVARATWSSGGTPGSFFKYLNGNWNSPAVGGNSTPLANVAGSVSSLHTPSGSILAVGNNNQYYWNKGFEMSASDNAVNWQWFGDPIITPDPITNPETLLYGSFLGPTGGYDIGSNFQFFYMWLPPGKTLDFRYQIYKDITLTYVGPNNGSIPSTKLALTSYFNSQSGDTWQSTQLALPPYKPYGIVGYIMSRPYSHSFVVYDCYNTGTGDHFVGTADDCFFDSTIQVLRTLGYIWATRRTPSTIAVYNCQSGNDVFLSNNTNCDGRGSAQTDVFGYMMTGPAINSSITSRDVLVPQGSQWKFFNTSAPPSTWTRQNFNDNSWPSGQAPFGTGYQADVQVTPLGPTNYYFRKTFTIPSGRTIQWLLLTYASDNTGSVYINNQLVDNDPATWHEAAYWNRRIYVNTNLVGSGSNIIAVQVRNTDQWGFFDLALTIKYTEQAPSPIPTCSPACINGQCNAGVCTCDPGWSGSTCATNLCSFSSATTEMIIAPGSSFDYTQWTYVPSTPPGWFSISFDDSSWHLGPAPFGTSNYANAATIMDPTRYLFREDFNIDVPNNKVISSATLYVASDDTHRVYVNGIFLGAPIFPPSTHTASYWNDVIAVDPSILVDGANIIAVEIPLLDGHTTGYFDMQLNVTYSVKTCSSPTTSTTRSSTTRSSTTRSSTTRSSSSTTRRPR